MVPSMSFYCFFEVQACVGRVVVGQVRGGGWAKSEKWGWPS
jgi:hypothetical protein